MLEWLGLIGSLFFAACAWPQAYMCVKNKTAKGIEWSFILLWWIGAVFSAFYALMTENYVLLPNFLCGGLGISIVLMVKLHDVAKEKQ